VKPEAEQVEPLEPAVAAPERSVAAPAHSVADPPHSVTDPPRGVIDPKHIVIEPERGIVVDFDPDEPGIYLSVELEGLGGRRKQLAYLFDSGASFLTITNANARELGIEIPADAPRIEFHTAAGMRSSPMIQLPALTVGEVRIAGLAVSICDPCATSRGAGLLGLNVIREFVIQTDYQTSQMRLLPRVYESRANRAYDITPMLELAIDGQAQIRDGDIEWAISLRNNSPVPVEAVIPRVNFKNGKQLRGQAVGRIEPGQTGRSAVTGKVLAEGEEGGALSYTLSLAEAYG
jgi:hypothetical protein